MKEQQIDYFNSKVVVALDRGAFKSELLDFKEVLVAVFIIEV